MRYAKGVKVEHRIFGIGAVITTTEDLVIVRFRSGDVRMYKAITDRTLVEPGTVQDESSSLSFDIPKHPDLQVSEQRGEEPASARKAKRNNPRVVNRRAQKPGRRLKNLLPPTGEALAILATISQYFGVHHEEALRLLAEHFDAADNKIVLDDGERISVEVFCDRHKTAHERRTKHAVPDAIRLLRVELRGESHVGPVGQGTPGGIVDLDFYDEHAH